MLRIFAIFLCLSSFAVSAEELTMVFHYPAGGSTDIFANSVIPSLTRDGVTVKKEFYKNCSAAVAAVENASTPTVLVAISGDFSYLQGTSYAKCPSQLEKTKPLVPLQGFSRGPLYLCATPGFEGTSFEKLAALSKAGKKIRVGYYSSPVVTGMLKKFAALHPDISFVMLPYSGGAAVRVAVNARDVELFLQAASVRDFVAQGSVCLATTSKSTKLPFIGEGSKGPFPEYYIDNFFLATEGALSKSLTAKIHKAYNSPESNESLNRVLAGVSNITPSEFIKQMTSYELIFLQ